MFERRNRSRPSRVPHPLYEVYQAHDPHYTGKATVPTLWDKKTRPHRQ